MANVGEDLLVFMTVIAHQPYSELQRIPVSVALRLERRFFEIVDMLFSKFKSVSPKDAQHHLDKIGPPSHWKIKS